MTGPENFEFNQPGESQDDISDFQESIENQIEDTEANLPEYDPNAPGPENAIFAEVQCGKCGEEGHLSSECPNE